MAFFTIEQENYNIQWFVGKFINLRPKESSVRNLPGRFFLCSLKQILRVKISADSIKIYRFPI